MLAWGMWKGIGWSAIVYIAGISGIDQQLYEAATVDGQGVSEDVACYSTWTTSYLLCSILNGRCRYSKQWIRSISCI